MLTTETVSAAEATRALRVETARTLHLAYFAPADREGHRTHRVDQGQVTQACNLQQRRPMAVTGDMGGYPFLHLHILEEAPAGASADMAVRTVISMAAEAAEDFMAAAGEAAARRPRTARAAAAAPLMRTLPSSQSGRRLSSAPARPAPAARRAP